MGSCNSDDHIAEDHIHIDKTTWNTEETQQMYRLGRVRNRLQGIGGWVGGALKPVSDSKPMPLASAVVQNIWSALRFPNPSVNQHRKQTNHKKGR